MITQYNPYIKITIKEYLDDSKNEGKVALFNEDIPALVADGSSYDWEELESQQEELSKQGNYSIIIAPQPKKMIQSFLWRSEHWA